MDQYWSYLLTIVGLIGFILAGKKIWWCWYVNVGCQALWFTYAIVTKQYGFIVASIVYTVVFTQNAIKWTAEHKADIHLDEMKRCVEKDTAIPKLTHQVTISKAHLEYTPNIMDEIYNEMKDGVNNARPDSRSPRRQDNETDGLG